MRLAVSKLLPLIYFATFTSAVAVYYQRDSKNKTDYATSKWREKLNASPVTTESPLYQSVRIRHSRFPNLDRISNRLDDIKASSKYRHHFVRTTSTTTTTTTSDGLLDDYDDDDLNYDDDDMEDDAFDKDSDDENMWVSVYPAENYVTEIKAVVVRLNFRASYQRSITSRHLGNGLIIFMNRSRWPLVVVC